MACLKVIIVGAGVSGLTLANCLQHAGIDFLVLEGKPEIGQHVGAGVGLEPNGDRILDQLGVRGDLLDDICPNLTLCFRGSDGKQMYIKDSPALYTRRTGYFPWVLERKAIMFALRNRLWAPEKVLLGKRVSRIDYEKFKPVVTCADGTTYHGDIVVGADGVHSMVRDEMWRLSEIEKPGSVSTADRQYITPDYKGIYGISDPVPGVEIGLVNMVVGVDEVCYWMAGKTGRLYWVLAEKLPEKLHFPNIPRYTEADTLKFAESKVDKPVFITDKAYVTFGDVWKERRVATMVTVEEGFLEQWTAGNIILIGDIVHKGTPETGQGANQAIETAASLANHLKRLVDNTSKKSPSSEDIQKCLEEFQAHRKPRAKAATTKLMGNVRALTLSTPILKFIVTYVSPLLGDLTANDQSQRYIGAERIEFLPIPQQSVGTMPFNPTQGIDNYESRKQRARIALPLMAIAISSLFMSTDPSPSQYGQLLELPVYLLWILEAGRATNFLKPIQFTPLFGILAHKFGLLLWANIWFFLYYTWSPIEVYAADDQRLIDIRYMRSLLPSIILSALLQALCMSGGFENLPASLSFPGFWWSTLVLFTITQRFVMMLMTDTTARDRFHNVKGDLPYIRMTIISAIILSTILFQTSGYQIALGSIVYNPRILGLCLGEMAWLGLLLSDLKRAKMINVSWVVSTVSYVLSMVVMGPGGTLLAAWAWREEILATRKHWAAVTKAG